MAEVECRKQEIMRSSCFLGSLEVFPLRQHTSMPPSRKIKELLRKICGDYQSASSSATRVGAAPSTMAHPRQSSGHRL